MKTLSVIVLLIAAGPAFAEAPADARSSEAQEQPARDASRASADANAQGEHSVCRFVEEQSTSRLARHRVCHTAAEWRAIARAND